MCHESRAKAGSPFLPSFRSQAASLLLHPTGDDPLTQASPDSRDGASHLPLLEEWQDHIACGWKLYSHLLWKTQSVTMLGLVFSPLKYHSESDGQENEFNLEIIFAESIHLSIFQV